MYANSDLAKIEKWAKENKMQFNEIKSKATLITRNRNNANINIYLNNRILEVVKFILKVGLHSTNTLII